MIMYHTHSKLSFILFFRNLKSSEKCHIRTATNLSAVIITILITFFIIISPIQSFCHAKANSTDISTVFNSDAVKQKLTLSETHDMITNAAQLKQNILYKDTIKNNAVNYYYINNPAATKLLCIKCISGKLTASEIQFFDDTNNEIKATIINQKNYFYIDIKKLIIKSPSATRIYITAGSRKTSDIKIIYTQKIAAKKGSNKITNSNNSTKNNSNNTTTDKKDSNKSTIKKTANEKNTKKHITKKSANEKDTNTHTAKKSTTKCTTRRTTKKYNNTGSKKAPAKNSKTVNAIRKKTVQKSKTKKNNIHNRSKKLQRRTNSNTATKSNNKNKITHHKTTDKNKTKKQNTNNKYVRFSAKFITLKIGKNIFLTYKTNIKITNKTKIIWTSSNSNIVSTNGHKITAHCKGLAIITLTIKDGSICKKAICTIRVT